MNDRINLKALKGPLMKVPRSSVQLIASAAVVLSSQPVIAGVIYSNLGPSDGYSIRVGATVGLGASAAASFVPASTGRLNSVDMAISFISTPPQNVFDVQLAADNNGLPGAPIEDLGNTITTFSPIPGKLVTAFSTNHPVLNAATRYWFEALPVTAPPGTLCAWWQNNTGDHSPSATFSAGPGWTNFDPSSFPDPALRVNSVPEPSSIALAIIAIAVAITVSLSSGYSAQRESR